ncbi:MAG: hypothetical protein ACI837_002146 [Crocinitomicaceae bacterium]|jgi:hypothetical protein
MRILLLVSLTFLYAGSAFSQLKRSKTPLTASKISINSITNATKEDFIANVSVPLPFMKLSNTAFSMDFGLDIRYYSLKYGGIDLDYSYSVFLTETSNNPGYYWSTKISPHNINVGYSYPIIRREKTQSLNVPVSKENSRQAYYTNLDVPTITTLNLRLGFAQFHSTTSSDTYTNRLLANYSDFWPIGIGGADWDAYLQQSSKILEVGASYNRFYNTRFAATGVSGITNYDGYKTSQLSFYSNLRIGLNSETSPVTYTYNPFGNPNGSGGSTLLNVTEVVSLDSIVKYNRIGLSLGIEYTNITRKHYTQKVTLEVGLSPGYNDNLLRSIYLKLKLNYLGIGLMSH